MNRLLHIVGQHLKYSNLDQITIKKDETYPNKYELWNGSIYLGRYSTYFDPNEKPHGYFDMDGVFCNYDKKIKELLESGQYTSPEEAKHSKGFYRELFFYCLKKYYFF